MARTRPFSAARLVLAALLSGLAFAASPGSAMAQTDEALYRNAIDEARAGRTREALVTLERLAARNPQRRDILGDYAVVLGWAEQHAAALTLVEAIDVALAPAYVLEGLAFSARSLQRYAQAESLYTQAIALFPLRVEARFGLALTLAAAERNPVAELAAWQAILLLEPEHRAALLGIVRVLARLGAPQLALDSADRFADRTPGLLTPAERAALAADRTAQHVRWGAITADSGLGEARFAAIDSALVESENAAARAAAVTAVLDSTERQLVLDRIIALRDRFRMRDAVALYEAMQVRLEAVPAYAKSAAASAYLYLKQPERARDLYREALADDADNLEMRLGLFYALAESEQHAEALALADGIAAATPQWIDAWSPATIRANPAYARALGAQALAPLFADRPGVAEQRLHALADRAPFHMGIRTDHASSMRARGWARAAEQELRWILAVEPDNSGALGERAGALLEMQSHAAAVQVLAQARAAAAEDGRVVRAGRLLEVHEMRELSVDANAGRSSGGPAGTSGRALEARLYSSPLDDRFRAYAHLFDAQATFAAGTARRERAGIGLEYRSPQVVASGELSHGLNGSRTGAAASLAYRPDDHWTLRGTLDSSSNAIPLQAHLAGINAQRVSAEALWRAHESRSAAVSVGLMAFSDSNRREFTQARWTERVVAGPRYKLDLTAALYASRNSLAGAPYFNPSRDLSPTLEVANEWLQWRRYSSAFRHRLVASAGSYWQQGFGAGKVAALRYEQEWTADDRLALRYGIGRSLHPYDGAQTGRNYAYLSLNWRF